MKHALLLSAALLLAGCAQNPFGCRVFDTCPTWTDDSLADQPDAPFRLVTLPSSDLAEKLRAGDWVRVLSVDGRKYRFFIDDVAADSFHGRARDDKWYRIPYAQIRRIGILREKDGEDFMGGIVFELAGDPPR